MVMYLARSDNPVSYRHAGFQSTSQMCMSGNVCISDMLGRTTSQVS